MRKCDKYFKNVHNTKKPIKNITDAPNGDAKIVADDDVADAPNTADDDSGSTNSKTSQYSLRNQNNAPDSADDDVASLDSLIDSKLKHKIDPSSTIKLKKE